MSDASGLEATEYVVSSLIEKQKIPGQNARMSKKVETLVEMIALFRIIGH